MSRGRGTRYDRSEHLPDSEMLTICSASLLPWWVWINSYCDLETILTPEFLVFLFVFTLACLGTIIFQCLPIRAIWEVELQPPIGNARCYSNSVYRSIGLFNGCMVPDIHSQLRYWCPTAINIFTDVLFASLPIPIILTLQVNVRTKATLIAILSIGYLYVEKQAEMWSEMANRVWITARVLPRWCEKYSWQTSSMTQTPHCKLFPSTCYCSIC